MSYKMRKFLDSVRVIEVILAVIVCLFVGVFLFVNVGIAINKRINPPVVTTTSETNQSVFILETEIPLKKSIPYIDLYIIKHTGTDQRFVIVKSSTGTCMYPLKEDNLKVENK